MLALFTLSPLEMLILLGIGLFIVLGIATVAVVVVLLAGRKDGRKDD